MRANIFRSLSGRPLTVLVTAAFVLPALAFGYAGLFSRYVADDFCTASVLVEHGFVAAQQYWYGNWSGRFAFFFVIDALNWLGPWTVPLTPVVLLVAWIAATVQAIGPLISRVTGREVRLWTVLLSLVLTTTTLASSPALWQALYWQTGSVTYLLPIILMTAYVGMLWRVERAARIGGSTTPWTLAGAAMMVVAVGCSETAMGLVVCALGLATATAVLLVPTPRRPALVGALGTALLASLLASALVIAAPGNSVRADFFLRPSLPVAVIKTLWFPCYVFFNFLVHAPVYLVLAYAVPFFVGRQAAGADARSNRTHYTAARRLIMLGAVVLGAASGAPAVFAVGGPPPARAQTLAQLVLVATAMGCGLLDGLATRSAAGCRPNRLRQRAAVAVGTAAMVFGPLLTTGQTIAQANELRTYAATLDTIDQQLQRARAGGDTSVTIQRVDQPAMVALGEVGDDSSAFPNRCVADYYGLESIVAVDRPA